MARFQLELGPVPMHHQVYLDLRSSLDSGTWRPDDRLPTERDLAGHYGVSLITVRRALAELVHEGRIERTRGRGTFVLRPRLDRDIASRASFADEMQERGLDPETRLISARPESATVAVASRPGAWRPARRRCTSSGCDLRPANRTCSSRSTSRPSGSPGCWRAISSTRRCTS